MIFFVPHDDTICVPVHSLKMGLGAQGAQTVCVDNVFYLIFAGIEVYWNYFADPTLLFYTIPF